MFKLSAGIREHLSLVGREYLIRTLLAPALGPERKSIKLTVCGFLFSSSKDSGCVRVRHPAKCVKNMAFYAECRPADTQNSFLKFAATNLLNIEVIPYFPLLTTWKYSPSLETT